MMLLVFFANFREATDALATATDHPQQHVGVGQVAVSSICVDQ